MGANIRQTPNPEQLNDFELWEHFDKLNLDCWVDVGEEASKIYGSWFSCDVGINSNLDDLFKSVALAGRDSALIILAKKLDKEFNYLQKLVSE